MVTGMMTDKLVAVPKDHEVVTEQQQNNFNHFNIT